MFFLLRLAFWLGLVLVLLPRDKTPEADKTPQISASDAVSAATATIGTTTTFLLSMNWRDRRGTRCTKTFYQEQKPSVPSFRRTKAKASRVKASKVKAVPDVLLVGRPAAADRSTRRREMV